MAHLTTRLKRFTHPITTALLLTAGLVAGPAVLAQGGQRYEVTVTNLTRGQQFTPILVASHREGVNLFTLGSPASPQLSTLAEEGNTGPLTTLLLATPGVRDVVTSMGLLNPGASVTVTVEASEIFDHLSVAAMLIPTNDGFFAINGVQGPPFDHFPRGFFYSTDDTLTLFSQAYDAGSERNDELCASIPGPNFAECKGPGGGAKVGGGEGYVHIHAGIHGIGDLNAAVRDWRNPIAKVTIRRVGR